MVVLVSQFLQIFSLIVHFCSFFSRFLFFISDLKQIYFSDFSQFRYYFGIWILIRVLTFLGHTGLRFWMFVAGCLMLLFSFLKGGLIFWDVSAALFSSVSSVVRSKWEFRSISYLLFYTGLWYRIIEMNYATAGKETLLVMKDERWPTLEVTISGLFVWRFYCFWLKVREFCKSKSTA